MYVHDSHEMEPLPFYRGEAEGVCRNCGSCICHNKDQLRVDCVPLN